MDVMNAILNMQHFKHAASLALYISKVTSYTNATQHLAVFNLAVCFDQTVELNFPCGELFVWRELPSM